MLASPTRAIRVFVIDPQPLIAAALAHLIEANESLHTAGSAQQVKPLMLRTLCPDVVLLSHEHGSTQTCAMVDTCREAVPHAKICIVACHAHPELLHSAIDAGVDGYIIKDTEPGELINAVRTIAAGTMYVDPRVGAYLLKSRSRPSRGAQLTNLSLRETEIVKLIAAGLSNKEISSSLNLSEKTVKNHVSRIFAKLHITARTQAVMHAVRSGIA